MRNLPFFALLAFLLVPSFAQAANCTDRDYRGLNVDKLPPQYAEAVCQFKLLLKNRTDADRLKSFVALSEELTKVGPNDVDWNGPLVANINSLINEVLADNNMHKLAAAAQKFFGPGSSYRLNKEELQLIDMLTLIEVQKH